MADAILRSGNPTTVQYTPTGGNVAEGEVVVRGSVTANTSGTGAVAMIAQRPITNNEQGTLSDGGGLWQMVNLNNAATGAKVYWDIVNNTRKVTSVSTNNAVMGWITEGGGGGANSNCYVRHAPYHGNA